MAFYVRASRLDIPVWDGERMHYAKGHNEYKPWQDEKWEIASALDKHGRVAAFSKNWMIAVDEDGNDLPVDDNGDPKWPGLARPRIEAKLVTPKQESHVEEVAEEKKPTKRKYTRKVKADEVAAQ